MGWGELPAEERGTLIVDSAKLASRKRHEWTQKKKASFCEALATGVTVETAAKSVGMSRSGAYKQRESDPTFAEAWQAAYDASTELLEQECFQRAVGREEPVLGKDGEVHYVKKHSDLLLIFLLKARKPRVCRETVDLNISEKRHIIVELLQVVKDEATGKLVLADDTVPLLSAGDGDNGQDD